VSACGHSAQEEHRCPSPLAFHHWSLWKDPEKTIHKSKVPIQRKRIPIALAKSYFLRIKTFNNAGKRINTSHLFCMMLSNPNIYHCLILYSLQMLSIRKSHSFVTMQWHFSQTHNNFPHNKVLVFTSLIALATKNHVKYIFNLDSRWFCSIAI